VYPVDSDDLPGLQKAIDKFILQDRSLTVVRDSSEALGSGFWYGLLGLLHSDSFRQRIEQEYVQTLLNAVSPTDSSSWTTPSSSSPSQVPERFKIKRYLEPFCDFTIVALTEYVGYIINFCMGSRGIQRSVVTAEMGRSVLKNEIPMSELILDFYD
jgi:GTP-binding protein LepA